MSYFKKMIEETRGQLPLTIDEFKWDGTLFYMGGKNWHFNASADWAIVTSESMLFGCHDTDVEMLLGKYILGNQVVLIEFSMDIPIYDPIFILKDGIKIKFFSTSFYEPWTMFIEGETMYVASPGDKNWVLKR